MTGQMSVPVLRSLRAQLGLTQSRMARELGCTDRTIRRAERGHTAPSSLLCQQLMRLARRKLERTAQESGLPIHYVDLVRMELCLSKPGAQWRRWNGQQRACYLAHRAVYRRILADVQAGRAMLVPRPTYPQTPVAAALDNASDLDTL